MNRKNHRKMIIMFQMNVNQKLKEIFPSNFILYTVVSSILKLHIITQKAKTTSSYCSRSNLISNSDNMTNSYSKQ